MEHGHHSWKTYTWLAISTLLITVMVWQFGKKASNTDLADKAAVIVFTGCQSTNGLARILEDSLTANLVAIKARHERGAVPEAEYQFAKAALERNLARAKQAEKSCAQRASSIERAGE